MSRKAFLAGLVLSPILFGTYVAVAAGQPFFAPEPPTVAGQPYSAVAKTESITVFSDGNRIVRTNEVHFFRDSQGRTRTERIAGEGRPAAGMMLITISDPVSGERYILHPQTRTVDVWKLRPGLATAPVAADSLDVGTPFALLGFGMGIGAHPAFTEASSFTTSLGQKVIEGLTVTGTRLVRTIPSGALGNDKPIVSSFEEWVSPDLGVPVLITQKSSIGGQLTLKLSNVVRAQPDETLFAPPSDYTRRTIGMQAAASAAAPLSMVSAVKKP